MIDAVLTEELIPFLNERNIKKIMILLTHGHYDHILGLEELRKKFPVTVGCLDLSKEVLEDPRKNLTAVATLINEMRRKKYNLDEDPIIVSAFRTSADLYFSDGETFCWHDMSFRFVSTPGHSNDSACIILNDEYMFSGDSFVESGEPVLELPGGNRNKYFQYALPFYKSVDENIIILPGHGEVYLKKKGKEIMEEKIAKMIEEINDEVVEDFEKDLLASGVLDSFDIINLIVLIEEEYEIEVDAEKVTPENFRSVNAIVSLVKNIRDENI